MSSLRSAPAFDTLEPRAMLAAPTPTVANIWAEPTALVMVVDWENVDSTTLGVDDFQMNKVGGPVINPYILQYPTVVNGRLRVTYGFRAYDNAWGVTDTGSYEWRSPVGNVLSPQGETIADPVVRTGDMWFGAPKARLVGQTMRESDWLLVVQFDSINGIDESTISGQNLTVYGPLANTPVTVHSIVPWGPGSTRVVYRVAPQNGFWTSEFNGRPTLQFSAWNHAVKDVDGRMVAQRSFNHSYNLWFAEPSAMVLGTQMNENDWIIPVVYKPRVGKAINLDSLTAGAAGVKVVGPGGFEKDATVVDVTPSWFYGANAIIVSYRIEANGGAWDYRDNGAYTLKHRANEVFDNAGAAVHGYDMKTFSLWFSTPTAEILAPSNPTQTQWDLNIRFRDNTQINQATITAASIRIVGPGGAELSASLISISGTNPSFSATALYRLIPSGGTFANGEYRVYLNRDGVRDAGGLIAAETLLGTFNMNF